MSSVYLSHNNIISALGFDSKQVVDKVSKEISGLHLVNDSNILDICDY